MKFEPGDIAIIKNTGEETKVIRIIDDKMVEIEIDGISFPAFVDELDTPYWGIFKKEREARQQQKQQQQKVPQSEGDVLNTPTGFHVVFSPIFEYDGFEDVANRFKVYLANHSPFNLEISIDCKLQSGSLFQLHKIVNGYDSVFLQEIAMEAMQQQPTFICHLRQGASKSVASHLTGEVKVGLKNLYKQVAILQKTKRFYFYQTIAKHFPDVTFDKVDISKVTFNQSSRHTTAPSYSLSEKKVLKEIDLHIENLTTNPDRLKNFEKLNLQLHTLDEALEHAIDLGQQSMVIIHGVGSGALKEEVHRRLKANGHVDFFIHDWMPRYGWGATEVFFK